MLKCEMCLGRRIDAELAVLRSADRGIEYHEGNAIEISNDNRISVKVDNATIRIDPVSGALTVDIPDTQAVNSIVEALSRYPLNHNYNDLRPLVPNGPNRGKWATETVGANNKPIYLNQGVLTPSNANIGTANKPVYMNDGNLTVCGNHLDINAESANKDSAGQTITTTYIKDVTINSDKTVTVTKGDGTSSTSDTLATILNDLKAEFHGNFKYYAIPSGESNGYVFDLPKTLNTYLVYMVKGAYSNIVQGWIQGDGWDVSAQSILNNVFLAGRFEGTNRKIWAYSRFSVVSDPENVHAALSIGMNNNKIGLGNGFVAGTSIIVFY